MVTKRELDETVKATIENRLARVSNKDIVTMSVDSAALFLNDHRRLPSEMTTDESDMWSGVLECVKSSANDAVILLLLERAYDDSDIECKGKIMEMLKGIEQNLVANELMRLFAIGDGDQMEWLCEVSGQFGDDRVCEYLKALCSSRCHPGVAFSAYEALSKINCRFPNEVVTAFLSSARSIVEGQYELVSRIEGVVKAQRLANITATVDQSFRLRDYKSVVTLLEPFEDSLPLIMRRKLEIARRRSVD